MTNLDRLENLTNEIGEMQRATPVRAFMDIARRAYTPSIVNIEMEKGTGIMFGLINEPECSVTKTFLSANSRFFEHVHRNQKEYILMVSGEASFYLEQEETILKYSDFIYIPPEVVHYCTTDVDCWFLAIIFPEDKSWPEGLQYYGDHRIGKNTI